MFTDFTDALELHLSPTKHFVVVEEHENSPGRTSLYHTIGWCIKNEKPVVLVASTGSIWQYAFVLRKIGIHLDQAHDAGLFNWIHCTPDGLLDDPSIIPTPSAPNPPHLPPPSLIVSLADQDSHGALQTILRATRDGMASKGGYHLLIENIPTLLLYCEHVRVNAFLQGLHSLAVEKKGCIIALVKSDVEEDDTFLTTWEHRCDLLLRYTGLESGIAKDVDCLLEVQYTAPGQPDHPSRETRQSRYHVRAVDNMVQLRKI